MFDAQKAIETGVSRKYRDAIMGTWTADIKRSRFSGDAPQVHTRKYEPAGDGYKLSVEGLTAKGQRISWEYTASYDGKDYAVKGSSTVDTISLAQVDDRTTLGIFKKGGIVTAAYKRTISADQTLEIVTAGANDGAGRPYFDVTVYQKQ